MYFRYGAGMTISSKTVRQTSVGRMLNLLSRRLNNEMEARLKKLGLNLNGFFIIMTLLEDEGLTQSALGKRTRLPAYGITRQIDSLQEAGLVERRDDPNSRRNHLVFLTTRGREMAPQVFAVVQGVNEWLLGELEPAERQAFSTTLAKLV